jgi:hypothetical protein
LRDADDALDDVRLVGDLVVAAFFQGGKPKEREAACRELSTKVRDWLATRQGFNELHGFAAALREGERPVVPFHWQIEFPEVFERDNPGFDAIVGNPPFAGKNTLISNNPRLESSAVRAGGPERTRTEADWNSRGGVPFDVDI